MERKIPKGERMSSERFKFRTELDTTGIPRCEECGGEIDTSFLPTYLCRSCYRRRLTAIHGETPKSRSEAN
jgi:ABC-type ATPase with predicted acetyltransferase domain